MKNNYLNIYILFYLLLFSNDIYSQKKEVIEVENFTNLIVFTNVSIFDGENEKILINKDVFIKENKIEKIVNTKSMDYGGYNQIDGTGKYIMPGLIDAHVHIQSNGSLPWVKVKVNQKEILDATIYCGITTVFDLGGIAKKSYKIKKSKNTKLDIYNSHVPITIPGSHPIPASKEALPFPLNMLVGKVIPTVTSQKEAEKVVKRYCKQKIDYVKIICDELPIGTPEMNFETLKWIIDEVHKNNFKAVVHISSVKNALDAINAGADILAHGILRDNLSDEEARTIAESKIPIIYTLFAFEFNDQLEKGVFTPNYFDSILVPQKLLFGISGRNSLQIKNTGIIHAFASNLEKEKKYWKNNLDLLVKHEANILVGTDAGTPGYYHGVAMFHEIDELKRYNLKNYNILKGATYLSANAFLNNPDFGKIAEGFQADLLLIEGNPLENIELIKTPLIILSNGIIIKRL